ncbi:chloramphenicol phosphotransferase CPT family protein [Bradyrhizobium prioriisuperbiae]|uniref:chloramphenicol phosphotransferase CPT family protein n=1 Tax=Bradyrhizobium prioriisuperbiae TaxID=2854389 RepID=UPI0028F0C004|nr:chloramphenicol phosphotransferase [Bradyrhizobium prioritasuperba]
MPQGQIVILNGAPRSGKSSIAAVIQETFEGPWISLGVDVYASMIPARYRPGIGLRPGCERPDLEAFVPTFYAALYDSIAAHSRLGLNVVVDVGHHDDYTRPLNVLQDCARRLLDLPVLFVGVHCPLDVIMKRRSVPQSGREGQYVTGSVDQPAPHPVVQWQRAVHSPGLYDLNIDTSLQSPEACADAIRRQLERGMTYPTAFQKLAAERYEP